MNAIDIVCLVIILLLMLLGLWHGFFRGIFRLMAWAAGIAGAYFACGLLANFISGLLQTSAFSTKLVCMCIGFLVHQSSRAAMNFFVISSGRVIADPTTTAQDPISIACLSISGVEMFPSAMTGLPELWIRCLIME